MTGGPTGVPRTTHLRPLAGHTPGVDTSEPVRREGDGELLGYVRPDADGWLAVAVFGGRIGRAETRDAATRIVRDLGLAVLARRWFHRDRRTGAWQVVVLTEAWPGRARASSGCMRSREPSRSRSRATTSMPATS
jgi:hypothetical protein